MLSSFFILSIMFGPLSFYLSTVDYSLKLNPRKVFLHEVRLFHYRLYFLKFWQFWTSWYWIFATKFQTVCFEELRLVPKLWGRIIHCAFAHNFLFKYSTSKCLDHLFPDFFLSCSTDPTTNSETTNPQISGIFWPIRNKPNEYTKNFKIL